MADESYVPPARSLLWAKPIPEDEGGGIELGCDCGTVTQLILEGLDEHTPAQELAVTCDGCQSVRWITVGPVDQLEKIGSEGEDRDG